MASPTCASCLRKAEAGFLRPCADIGRQGSRRSHRRELGRRAENPVHDIEGHLHRHVRRSPRMVASERPGVPQAPAVAFLRPRRRHERNHIFRIGFLPGLHTRWGLLRRPFPRRGRIGKHSNRVLARHQQIDCHEDARRQRCGVAHHLTPCVIAARPSSASWSARVRFPRRRRA